MSKSTATSTITSITEIPVAEKSLDSVLYYGPCSPEDDLFYNLRQLRSLLLAALNSFDDDTDELNMQGKEMRELLGLAFDLTHNANEHAESWSNNESEVNQELKRRADQLPERDELWIKCNIATDRKLTRDEKTAAINGMIAQIKPVIVTSHTGKKITVEPHKLQVQEGWNGESVVDGCNPQPTIEEIKADGTTPHKAAIVGQITRLQSAR